MNRSAIPFALPASPRGLALAMAVALASGCATKAPEPPQTVSPGPTASRPGPVAATPPARIETSSPRSLAEWKRSAAERIHAANRSQIFTGAPPNPLRAVVVVEMTVAADGRVQRADLMRVPGHAKELGAVALKTLNAASPLPAPPRALVAQGPIRTTETWLFREDGHFQIRTLASAQASE
jgi:protein TonB